MRATTVRKLMVSAAAVLALASAGERCFAAPLSLQAADLDGRAVAIPHGLPADRTLLLVGFHHADHTALEDWRRGLGLSLDDPAWLETPIIGIRNGFIRTMILDGMRRAADTAQARAHIAPAFADAKLVADALGVDPARPAVVVVDRTGRVLARASGDYEPAQARTLMQALR